MNLQILCLVFPLVFTIAYSGPVLEKAVSENVTLAKPSETLPVISSQEPVLTTQSKDVSDEPTPLPGPFPPYDTPNISSTVDPPLTTSTTTPKSNTTTTPVNPPTTSTTTTTTTTTVKPTDKPTTTTVKPAPTTVAPNVTTTHAPVTTTALPPSKDRKFDGPSFIGGIILALGLVAIGFVSWKFYKARTERNYHTL